MLDYNDMSIYRGRIHPSLATLLLRVFLIYISISTSPLPPWIATAHAQETALVKLDRPLLFVSLANGHLVAIDEETGVLQWTFDTGSPLLASANPAFADADGSFGLKDGIFPGTDGSLYIFRSTDENSPRVEKLPFGVKDLVESSPAHAPDGSLVLGSQRSSIFILDARSGTLLRSLIHPHSDSQLSKDQVLEDPAAMMYLDPEVGEQIKDGFLKGGDDRRVLVIGRKDYAIQGVHPFLGQQWNLSWSRIHHLTWLDSDGLKASDGLENQIDLRISLPNAHRSLKRYDPKTGQELWAHQFSSPPLVAYPTSGPPVDLVKSLVQLPASDKNSVGVIRAGDGLFGIAVPSQLALEQCSADSEQLELEDAPEGAPIIGDTSVCMPLGYFPVQDRKHPLTHGEHQISYLPPSALEPAPSLQPPTSSFKLTFFFLSSMLIAGGVILAFAIIFVISTRMRSQQRRRLTVAKESTSRSNTTPDTTNVTVSTQKKGGKRPKKNVSNLSATSNSVVQNRKTQTNDTATRVGRLLVGPGILGYGSGGTIVFEGQLDGRAVAVKRVLWQFVHLARKEIETLILSDEHPNIVRCFAMEEDSTFVYLALERCAGTLADLLTDGEDSFNVVVGGSAKPRSNISSMASNRAVNYELFVSNDGTPTPLAFAIAHDIGLGLAALHGRGIVHRDVKPHNVLLSDFSALDKLSVKAKLSDMGLAKSLRPDQLSFETVGIAGGSPGWQAPEQLAIRGLRPSALKDAPRQTAAIDVFSYGLLIHYTLTGGEHPFGEGVQRDATIANPSIPPKISGSLAIRCPEACNLLTAMLQRDPDQRPCVEAILAHPLWWSAARKLAFFVAVSDRVEGCDREQSPTMYAALECLSSDVFGDKEGGWAAALDAGLVDNLGKYRKYEHWSLRDLLRVIRNKHSHYREMPSHLQEALGPIPDGFVAYFTSRFPNLLITCFYFAMRWCAGEPAFQSYFPPKSTSLLRLAGPKVFRSPEIEAVAVAQTKARLTQLARSGNDLANGGNDQKAEVESGMAYVAPPVAVVRQPTGALVALFPRHSNRPVCEFYAKTGHCRFGETCRYDHPMEYSVRLNPDGLPLRPGEPACAYYARHGVCKYGPSCRFSHPMSPGLVEKVWRPPGF